MNLKDCHNFKDFRNGRTNRNDKILNETLKDLAQKADNQNSLAIKKGSSNLNLTLT